MFITVDGGSNWILHNDLIYNYDRIVMLSHEYSNAIITEQIREYSNNFC